MALKGVVDVQSGPDGNGGWVQSHSISARLEAATISDTEALVVLGTVPTPDSALAGGQGNPEPLAPGAPIMRLVRATVTADDDLAGQTHLNLLVTVYRDGDPVTASVHGYSTDDAGTPAFDAMVPAELPGSIVNVLPDDVLVLQADTDSSTVAWPGGAITVSLT